VAESFFATLKTELANNADWHTREQAHGNLSLYRDVVQPTAAAFAARLSLSVSVH